MVNANGVLVDITSPPIEHNKLTDDISRQCMRTLEENRRRINNSNNNACIYIAQNKKSSDAQKSTAMKQLKHDAQSLQKVWTEIDFGVAYLCDK